MILYHGSNMPVRTPEVRPSTRAMDFGAGFYCAANRAQAIEFAHKVVARSVKFGRAPGIATVTVYEFDEAAAQGVLHMLRYEKPDSRWLNQVTEFRLRGDMGEGYDLIVGPVYILVSPHTRNTRRPRCAVPPKSLMAVLSNSRHSSGL
jgi:hypothetical protein